MVEDEAGLSNSYGSAGGANTGGGGSVVGGPVGENTPDGGGVGHGGDGGPGIIIYKNGTGILEERHGGYGYGDMVDMDMVGGYVCIWGRGVTVAYIVRGDMDVWLRTREGGGDEAGLILGSYTGVLYTSWGAQHVYRVGGKGLGNGLGA